MGVLSEVGFMDILYIEEFVELARVCNYNRAADALFISQSTLFNHIKALEAEMGVALFDRKGKYIILSDYGQTFLPYAKTIISASKEYRQIIKQRNQGGSSKKLCIGTQYRITDLIRDFRRQHPGYELHLFDNYSAMEALDQRICELAFIRDVPASEGGLYNIIPYVTDNIIAAVYSSHPLAGEQRIRLRELRHEDFVMVSQPQEPESYLMKICKSAGFFPRVVLTAVNGNETARLVNEEVGISLFLKKTITSENFDNLVPVDLDPPIKCDISLCWRKDKPLSPGAKDFVNYVRDLRGP